MVTDGTSWAVGWASGCQPAPGPARGTARTSSVPIAFTSGPWGVGVCVECGCAWVSSRLRVRGIEVVLGLTCWSVLPSVLVETELTASQLFVR